MYLNTIKFLKISRFYFSTSPIIWFILIKINLNNKKKKNTNILLRFKI